MINEKDRINVMNTVLESILICPLEENVSVSTYFNVSLHIDSSLLLFYIIYILLIKKKTDIYIYIYS